MLYRRKGLPEESELVLCTVTKVQYDSVFANLDEYDKSGMIHISEISPGRIRNIRDFVKEGKVIVCKILRVDQERGHIDLSLRRVTEMQKRQKINEIKQEQKAEKILEGVANSLKMNSKDLYNQVKDKIFENYSYVYECFNDVVEKNFSLESIGIEKKIAKQITDDVKEKIKPKEVEIKGELKLESYASDGIDIVKESLLRAKNPNIGISYSGAGKYKVIVKAKEYKDAEKILHKSVDAAIAFIESKHGVGEFSRIE